MRAYTCLAAVLTTLVLAGPAAASTVSKSGSAVVVTANAGETNGITAAWTSDMGTIWTVTDTAGATAGSGCAQSTSTTVRCTAISTITVNAGDGNDTVTVSATTQSTVAVNGGPGNDTLTGVDGASDVLNGEAGNDWLGGRRGLDTLDGGADDDTLDGGAGSDTLNGGTGNDTLDAGPGGSTSYGVEYDEDALNGGDGSDTVTYATRARFVRVTIDGLANDGDPVYPLYERDNVGLDVENVVAGSVGSELTGDGDANVLTGGAGKDTLAGGLGADVVIGAGDADVASYTGHASHVTADLDGAAGDDGAAGEFDTIAADIEGFMAGSGGSTVTGNAGSGAFTGGAGPDWFEPGAGGDTVAGGAGTDVVTYAGRPTPVSVNTGVAGSDGGSGENDSIGADVETIVGTDFDDTLQGASTANFLTGGLGNDSLRGSGGAGSAGDLVDGGPGDDVLGNDGSGTVAAPTILVGDDGDDDLRGSFGAEALDGGPGDDILQPDAGRDTVSGGADTDHVTYAASYSTVRVSLDGVANDGVGSDGDNVASDVERITGGGGADELTGDERAQTLQGGGGQDVLRGAGGADTLQGGDHEDVLDGGLGSDVLDGGTYTDTVTYAGRSESITVDLADVGDDGAPGENDTYADVEDIVGGDGDDTLTGRDTYPASMIDGGPGADTLTAGTTTTSLRGGAGDDVLRGAADGDRLDGGLGADDIAGGAGSDTIEYKTRAEDVTVRLDGLRNDGAAGENDLLAADIEHVETGSGDDVLVGDDGGNFLQGGGGDDVLDGGLGADNLSGGSGENTVTYATRTASVSVSLDGAVNDGETGENDLVQNTTHLIGGAGDDTLVGSSAANRLEGRGGDDVLRGAGDADTLVGGDGTDTASWSERATSVTADLDGVADETDGDVLGTDIENLDGGDGNDVLTGDGGPNRLSGAGGDDLLTGGPGDDRLEGGGAGDTLNGGPGDDRVDGGAGADALSGGSGSRDLATYASRTAAVTVDLDGEADDGEALEGDDVDLDIEDVVGGSGDDRLTGSVFANRLDGGGGDDAIDPGPGSDDVRGGDGDDALTTRDGAVDAVVCGGETDAVVRDAVDTVSDDCESVDPPRPAPVTPPVVEPPAVTPPGAPAPAPAPPTAPSAGVPRGSASVTADVRAPRLTLTVSSRLGRKGTLTLTVVSDEAATAKVAAAIGSRRFTPLVRRLRRGVKTTLTLRLPSRSRAAIRRVRKPRAKVTVTLTDATGNRTTRTVTVALRG